MTGKERSDLLDGFLAHYTATETPRMVDRYLAGLALLVGTPKNGRVDEDDPEL